MQDLFSADLITAVHGSLQAANHYNEIRAIDNPLNGVVPNFTVFGAEFNAWWKKLFGAGWALAIIFALAYLARGLVAMNEHQGGGHPSQLREARSQVKNALMALGGLAGLSVIAGAILFVAG